MRHGRDRQRLCREVTDEGPCYCADCHTVRGQCCSNVEWDHRDRRTGVTCTSTALRMCGGHNYTSSTHHSTLEHLSPWQHSTSSLPSYLQCIEVFGQTWLALPRPDSGSDSLRTITWAHTLQQTTKPWPVPAGFGGIRGGKTNKKQRRQWSTSNMEILTQQQYIQYSDM